VIGGRLGQPKDLMSANRQCQGLQTQCQHTAASGNPGKAIRRIVKQDGLRQQDEAGGPNQTLHTTREQLAVGEQYRTFRFLS
jgi:hypothetical protein